MYFAAYFDASRGDGITVVAGWLGTTLAWESFDVNWKILLAQYDVPYFHMREFAHSVGAFKGWKGQDGMRANSIRKAVDIIGRSAHYGLGCMIEDAIFAKVNQLYAVAEVFGNSDIIYSSVKARRPLSGSEMKNFQNLTEHYAEEIVQKWIDYFVLHEQIVPRKITQRIK